MRVHHFVLFLPGNYLLVSCGKFCQHHLHSHLWHILPNQTNFMVWNRKVLPHIYFEENYYRKTQSSVFDAIDFERGMITLPPPESPFPKNQPQSPQKKTQETPKKISKCNSSYAFYKEVKKATKWFPHESIANFHLAGYFLVCPGYQAPLTFREFWKTYLFRLILKRAKVVELSTLLFS